MEKHLYYRIAIWVPIKGYTEKECNKSIKKLEQQVLQLTGKPEFDILESTLREE